MRPRRPHPGRMRGHIVGPAVGRGRRARVRRQEAAERAQTQRAGRRGQGVRCRQGHAVRAVGQVCGDRGGRLRRQHARPAEHLPAALGRYQQQARADQVLYIEGRDRGRRRRRPASHAVALGCQAGPSGRRGAVDERRG